MRLTSHDDDPDTVARETELWADKHIKGCADMFSPDMNGSPFFMLVCESDKMFSAL